MFHLNSTHFSVSKSIFSSLVNSLTHSVVSIVSSFLGSSILISTVLSKYSSGIGSHNVANLYSKACLGLCANNCVNVVWFQAYAIVLLLISNTTIISIIN
jgi:hypothetical protein